MCFYPFTWWVNFVKYMHLPLECVSPPFSRSEFPFFFATETGNLIHVLCHINPCRALVLTTCEYLIHIASSEKFCDALFGTNFKNPPRLLLSFSFSLLAKIVLYRAFLTDRMFRQIIHSIMQYDGLQEYFE